MTESTVGMFTIDRAARRASGILLPYGVKSKGTSSSNTKPITFPRGNVQLPRDPMVIGLNDEHERFTVIGRADVLEDQDAGVYAEFSIADTDEGDRWLDEHGEKAYFSAEIKQLRRLPGDIGTGVLAGAAVTAAPAFDGTAIAMFSLIGDEPDEELELEETTDADAAPDEEPDEEPDDNPEEDDMAEATVADTAQFSRRPKAPATPALSKAGFFSAMRRMRSHADPTALQPYMGSMVGEDGSGLFALSDVKYDGTGGLAAESAQPNKWLGELWQGRRFSRTIVPLLTSGVLEGIQANGWVWTTKPTMATWAGNKANVPSNTPAVAPKQFFSQRFAGGHDLAREYFDFNQTDIIDSYVEAMIDSYASLSDGYALTQLLAGATAFTPVASTANKGLMAVIDGALAVVAAQATPSFAVVAPNVFRDIIGTPSSSALEYFNAAVGLEGASGAGFTILPDARLTAGQVLVGAKEAATAWELPGVPIRVSAPDLVKGGIDEAFFGYIAVGVTYPAAVVKGTVTITLEAEVAAK